MSAVRPGRPRTAPTPGRARRHSPQRLRRLRGKGRKAQLSSSRPTSLAVKHWDRLLGGLLYAATPRVDWATLLRRSFEIDVLRCAACGGRMRVLGEVTRADVIVLVLESLGLPTTAPRAARARDPTDLLGEQDDE
jgi:hypothetical protein